MQDPIKPLPAPSQIFRDGDATTGMLGTIVGADWLNTMQTGMQTTQSALQSAQQELASVIQNSGQKTDPSRQDQLLQALQNIAWGGSQKPTTLAGYGISDAASKSDLQTAVNNLVAGAPGALNTLQELAAALGNDANFAASITRLLAGKADKASTLAGYGIADGASTTQVIAAAPAGMVAYFAMKDAPAGWLVADGATKNCKDYPALFMALGTIFGGDGVKQFQLPNLQGEFIRCWDRGRGADPDSSRVLGSFQNQDFLSHSHASPTTNGIPTTPGREVGTNVGTGIDYVDGTGPIPTDRTGGPETRPRNIALLACIKY